MEMKPQVIQSVVACSAEQLAAVAAQHNIKKGIATHMRMHWTRRLLGQCVQCGVPTRNGACPKCGTSAEAPVEFLETLKPNDCILGRTCKKCHRAFSLNVKFVLRAVRRWGKFRPPEFCLACKPHKKKKEVVVKPSKKDPEKKSSSPPVGLTHRPFAGLTLQKSEK